MAKKKTFTAKEKTAWKEQQKEQTRKELEELTDLLLNAENVAGFLDKTMYTYPSTVPSSKWSALNKFKMFCSGTGDARGIKQWNSAGRKLNKGCKAVYILLPIFKEFESTEKKDKDGKPLMIRYLAYFKRIPVFRVEDTNGDELDYEKELKRIRAEHDVMELPLVEIAKDMGIEISYDLSNYAYGFYSRRRDFFGGTDEKKISLSTDAEQTFFHELSHAIDHHLVGDSFNSDKGLCEVVAEFTGCYLSGIYGTTEANLKYTREYVRSWSGKNPPVMKLAKAMQRAMDIVQYIVEKRAAMDTATAENAAV